MSIAKLLGGLLSDKVKRPVIVNGKLLTLEGRPVYVKMSSRYRVNFLLSDGRFDSNQELEEGEALIEEAANKFNEKYSLFVGEGKSALLNFSANIDSFTKAVVLHNGLYDFLLDIYDENHIHDGTRQFKPEVTALLMEFLAESFVNYFELYVVLLNKRLMGGHLPMTVKGHLVAGLYQPLLVQTRYIRSPLKFGEFKWFFDYLNNPEDTEEVLECTMQTSRALDLSVIAISDLQAKFGVPNIRELHRIHWMFILMSVLMRTYSNDGLKKYLTRYNKLYAAMKDGENFTPGGFSFFLALYAGIEKIHTSIAVR